MRLFESGVSLDGNHLRVAQTIHVEEAIARYSGPVLPVHGSDDETIPVESSIKAQKAYANDELEIIPGDTHCCDYHLDMVTDTIKMLDAEAAETLTAAKQKNCMWEEEKIRDLLPCFRSMQSLRSLCGG